MINAEFFSTGLRCPMSSASHACPHTCNTNLGEVLCPPNEQINGCLDEPLCMQRARDNDGEYCPYHSVCPVQCNLIPCNETLCHGGMDERGCKRKDLCIPREINKFGNYCPGQCPPICTDNEIFCNGANPEQWPQGLGCSASDFCLQKGVGIFGDPCPGACPTYCAPGERLKFKGFDENWCILPFYCE